MDTHSSSQSGRKGGLEHRRDSYSTSVHSRSRINYQLALLVRLLSVSDDSDTVKTTYNSITRVIRTYFVTQKCTVYCAFSIIDGSCFSAIACLPEVHCV